MPATDTDTHETEAKELVQRIRELKAERDTKHAAAVKVREDEKAGGFKITDTSPAALAAFQRIDAAFEKADRPAQEAAVLEARLHKLIDVASDDKRRATDRATGSTGNPAHEAQLRDLHAAVKNKQAGAAMLADVTAWPSPIDQRTDDIVEVRREPLRVSQLMPQRETESGTIRYWTQSAAATAAAMVAPGGAKPESSPGWTPVDAPVRKCAHFVDIPAEALADFEDFSEIVRTEMVNGLINQENAQVLTGAGTGENLTGLTVVAGTLAVTAGADTDHVALRKAITALRTGSAFCLPDVFLLTPANLEAIEIATGSDGHYQVDLSDGRVWRTPFFDSTQMPANTALAMNLLLSTRFYTREMPRILVDPYSQSANNIVRVICEERVQLAVIRPAAVCEINLV